MEETLKTYIGTKEVKAAPMDEATAVDKGFARKNVDNHEWRLGYNVQYTNPDGSTYDSWSPASVFNKSYRIADTFENRLYIEVDDLNDKLVKLRNALYCTDDFSRKVGIQQYSLMVAQEKAMESLINILNMRIDLLLNTSPSPTSHIRRSVLRKQPPKYFIK